VNVGVISSTGISTCNFAGVVLLVAMGTRLYMDLGKAQLLNSRDFPTGVTSTETVSKQSNEAWNPLAPTETAAATSWNNTAFRKQTLAANKAADTNSEVSADSPQAPAMQRYGSMVAPPAAVPDWVKEEPYAQPIQEEGTPIGSLLLAGLLSTILIFVMEVGDRSQYSFLSSDDKKGLSLIVGSMIGYMLATCIAALIGYFMEGTLDDKRLLYTAEMGFFALALVCFSQAILGLGPLSLGSQVTALLGLGSVTHTA
jgi:putative Ca2+/H+ antiporter (TMEM165/GDT1 family)